MRLLAKKNKHTVTVLMLEIDIRTDTDCNTLFVQNIIYSKNKVTTQEATHELVANPTMVNLLKRENTIADKKIREGYIELDNNQELSFDRLWLLLDDDTLSNSLGYILPMKAYPFINDTMIYPCFAQRKINGVRGSANFIWGVGTDLFTSEPQLKVVLRDKTGNLVDIQHIQDRLVLLYDKVKATLLDLNEAVSPEEIVFDGEFYIHGCPLGQINGAVHNKDNKNHTLLQFYIFDIRIKARQKDRFRFLSKLFTDNIDKYIYWVSFVKCYSDDQALTLREQYINEGFEGVILRNSSALYQKGRTKDMLKYKTLKRTLCLITNVVPYKKEPSMGMFEVEYPVNGTRIESVIKSTTGKATEYRQEVIINPHEYIGKYIMVEYREITADGKLFHTNAIFEQIQTNYEN